MVDNNSLAMVTGAAGDIGLALCERLANRGHQLVVVARNEKSAVSTAELFPGSIPVACDHSDCVSGSKASGPIGLR